jgi:hypothetical protein
MARPRSRGRTRRKSDVANPREATGIANRPRGEEAAEQERVHPRGKALGIRKPARRE